MALKETALPSNTPQRDFTHAPKHPGIFLLATKNNGDDDNGRCEGDLNMD